MVYGRFDTSRFDTNQSRFDTHVKSFRYTLTCIESASGLYRIDFRCVSNDFQLCVSKRLRFVSKRPVSKRLCFETIGLRRYHCFSLHRIIRRLEWLLISSRHFEKQPKMPRGLSYVGRSGTVINLSFCDHTQCVNCITEIFLLVNLYWRNKKDNTLTAIVFYAWLSERTKTRQRTSSSLITTSLIISYGHPNMLWKVLNFKPSVSNRDYK